MRRLLAVRRQCAAAIGVDAMEIMQPMIGRRPNGVEDAHIERSRPASAVTVLSTTGKRSRLSATSVTGGYVRGNTVRRPLVAPLTALPLPNCGTSRAHFHGPGERCATAQSGQSASSRILAVCGTYHMSTRRFLGFWHPPSMPRGHPNPHKGIWGENTSVA